MTKRNPLAVVALSLLTFGVYAYYWLYKTTDELREETGRDELRPGVDVLLAIATFGIWGIWAGYRNARIVHEEMRALGHEHSDRSGVVAVVAALSLVSGWAWLVAMGIAQDDLNKLADADADTLGDAVTDEELFGAPEVPEVSVFDDKPTRVAVRVELEPAAEPVEEGRWADSPSAPVFRSNAPMPVVF